MMNRKNFFDRFMEKFESLDPGSRQAYVLRLLRENNFFTTVVDALDEGVLIIDPELHIRHFNPAAQTMLALPDDLEKVTAKKLLPSVDWDSLRDGDEWVKSSRRELEIVYPERKYLQFYLTLLSNDPTLAVVLLRDVTTERRRTMELLQEDTGKAVAMLAAEVAHEIGNPLNSLYLNLQLLEGDTGLSEDEKEAMISGCRGEVERLDGIIRRFLNAITPGNNEFKLVDLCTLVLETISFMKQEIENRGISVKCSLPGKLPMISGDADALKQAVYNIIRNSLQAMSPGGSLQIECHQSEDFLTLEFKDDGVGINQSQMKELFKPFKSFTPGGHGIGMMIIERVCREHGAEFAVTSEPGGGTVISLSFPLPGRVRRKNLPG